MTTSKMQPSLWLRWWLPSIGATLWLAFLLGIMLSAQRTELINVDADPCWHLRTGLWMIEHGQVIRAEPFSHTRFGAPLLTHDWASEVIFAVAWKALGWNGVALLSALLIATCLGLLHRHLVSEGSDILISTLVVLTAAVACSIHWVARPLLFTHLITVIYAWQLRAYDRGQITVRALFVRLIGLMVIWVNLHGAFFIGLTLIWIYFCGGLWEWRTAARGERDPPRRKVVTWGSLFVLCLLATLLNPGGWRLLAHIAQFLRTPLLTAITPEFSSPDFHSNATRGFALELLLLAAVFVLLRPRLSVTELLLIGGWSILSLYTVRNVPVFAIVVAPILAQCLTGFVRDARNQVWTRSYGTASTRLSRLNESAGGYGFCMLVVGLLLWVSARTPPGDEKALLDTRLESDRFPVDAVSYLRSHPESVHGEMFNDYDWGGYLMLSLPERKVFIDGRNDFYGEELLREYLDVSAVRPNWDSVFWKHKVGWVIVPSRSPLASFLALHTGWDCVHEDETCSVYNRLALPPEWAYKN